MAALGWRDGEGVGLGKSRARLDDACVFLGENLVSRGFWPELTMATTSVYVYLSGGIVRESCNSSSSVVIL